MNNKLSLSFVLLATLFASTAMAHDEYNEKSQHPYCCPVCEHRCANLFPDLRSPFLNKFRGRRQALCEFRCTRRHGGYLPGHVPANRPAHTHAHSYSATASAQGLSTGIYPVHQPADCHIYCNEQHPAGSVMNYMCNERCHRVIFTPVVGVPEGAPLSSP